MKVGEYARLNSTLYNTVVILKIMEVYDNTILTENNGSIFQGEYGKDEIINHSYNITDLIEVGDYVNGTKVTMIAGTRYDEKDLHCYCDYCENKETGKWIMIPAKDIKSIITREQIESMEYKIGE